MKIRANAKKSVKAESYKRYSDAVPYEKRKYWYFTTHGLGPGMIPQGVHVLDTQEGQNKNGTWGDFILLDAVLNTDELRQYDLIELSPDMVDAACGKKSVKAGTTSWDNVKPLSVGQARVFTFRGDPCVFIGVPNGMIFRWYPSSYSAKSELNYVKNVIKKFPDDWEESLRECGFDQFDDTVEYQTWSAKNPVKSSRQRSSVKASYTYKYAVWVLDGDDNTWKCWSGKNSADLGMSEDEFLDSINHQTYPNPEYNVDNNYVDVMVIDGDKTPADYGQIENVKEYGKIAESTRRAIKAAEEAGTVTLDNMNTDVIPVVDFGTYGGPLSYALEDVFVSDYLKVDNLDPENEDEADALELINEGYDGTEDFFNQVLRLAPLYIQDAFDQYGIPAKVVSGSCKWNRPREYNYYDDTIEFSMTIDTNWVASKFAELSANEPKFADYLNDNYSSRSGFISFMPNEVEGYNDMLDPNSSDYWKVVSAIVMFMVYDDPSIRNDVTEDMIEYLRGNSDYASLSSYGIY